MDTMVKIFRLMKENGISTETLVEREKKSNFGFEKADNDLLCMRGGKWARLPFELGLEFEPVGLFPLANSDTFIEIATQERTSLEKVNKARLPSMDFIHAIEKAKGNFNQLDELMTSLLRRKSASAYVAPCFNGTYYAIDNAGVLCTAILCWCEDNWDNGPRSTYPTVSMSYDIQPNRPVRVFYVGQFHG